MVFNHDGARKNLVGSYEDSTASQILHRSMVQLDHGSDGALLMIGSIG